MRSVLPYRFLISLALPLALLFSAAGCSSGKEPMKNTAVISGETGPNAVYNGKSVPTVQGDVTNGLAVPDGNGGLVVLGGAANQKQNESYVDARELKLKVRELAEQLIADMNDCSLQGAAALPSSFVHLDDFDRTSSFGRLLGEQLIYEFNQRGYPVREYRMPGTIRVNDKGEFALSRHIGKVSAKTPVIVGTYYNDKSAVFVNARLVRPSDGRVLRTASLVLENNALTQRMLRAGGGSGIGAGGSGGKSSCEGTMAIRDFDRAMSGGSAAKAVAKAPATPFDTGADIH